MKAATELYSLADWSFWSTGCNWATQKSHIKPQKIRFLFSVSNLRSFNIWTPKKTSKLKPYLLQPDQPGHHPVLPAVLKDGLRIRPGAFRQLGDETIASTCLKSCRTWWLEVFLRWAWDELRICFFQILRWWSKYINMMKLDSFLLEIWHEATWFCLWRNSPKLWQQLCVEQEQSEVRVVPILC